MIHLLLSYLLVAMISWCPTEIHRFTLSPNLTIEEQDAYTTKRYQDIANDLVAVVLDPKEDPIFSGSLARFKTAVMILSIASYESQGFLEAIDTVKGTGDHGRSHCLMQVMLRPGESMVDRKDCFRLGLARIRESFNACSNLKSDEKLAVYASGNCGAGHSDSRMKFYRFKKWIQDNPIPISNDPFPEDW